MKNIDKYIISKLSSSFLTVMIGLLSLAWLSQVLKLLDEIEKNNLIANLKKLNFNTEILKAA